MKTRYILIAIGIIILIRLLLPYVVLHYANKALAEMEGYNGHIKDIDLAIYRGAYKIKNININKVDSVKQEETEFFKAGLIDLSVHWKALFQGKISGELKFTHPAIHFTKDKTEPAEVRKDSSSFKKLLNGFMPLKISHFEIADGIVHYIDSGASPHVNIHMDNVRVVAQNLTSVKDTALLPAVVKAFANVYGGRLDLNMKLDPLAESPTFDINIELKNTRLPKLNNFFKAYAKCDVNSGTFGLYTEVAATKGNFVGYVKPIIKNLDVVGLEDRKDNALQKIWENVVGTVGVALRNQKHEQLATKIPLEGTFKNTEANLWYAAWEVLQNAFIQALQPAIDHEINIGSVQAPPQEEKNGFIKKVFGKDTETKKGDNK